MFKTTTSKTFMRLTCVDRKPVVVRVEKIISIHEDRDGTHVILEEDTSYTVSETVDEIFNKT